MAQNQRDELVFVPLGGVGEIGMNMGAYGFGPERSRKWIVVDCGVTFGGPDLRTLYITATSSLYAIELAIRGELTYPTHNQRL